VHYPAAEGPATGDTESTIDSDGRSIGRESARYNGLVFDEDLASRRLAQEARKTAEGRSNTDAPAHSTIRLSQSFNDLRELRQAKFRSA
jgi:hypothetical protein